MLGVWVARLRHPRPDEPFPVFVPSVKGQAVDTVVAPSSTFYYVRPSNSLGHHAPHLASTSGSGATLPRHCCYRLDYIIQPRAFRMFFAHMYACTECASPHLQCHVSMQGPRCRLSGTGNEVQTYNIGPRWCTVCPDGLLTYLLTYVRTKYAIWKLAPDAIPVTSPPFPPIGRAVCVCVLVVVLGGPAAGAETAAAGGDPSAPPSGTRSAGQHAARVYEDHQPAGQGSAGGER